MSANVRITFISNDVEKDVAFILSGDCEYRAMHRAISELLSEYPKAKILNVQVDMSAPLSIYRGTGMQPFIAPEVKNDAS